MPKKSKKTKNKRLNKNDTTTYVYILQSIVNKEKSYIGVTNNLKRRISQHNGLLSGGARYTRNFRQWKFYAVFEMKNRHDALSLEWRSKHRKSKNDGTGVEGKVQTILRIGKLYQTCKKIQ
jgi:putative endonuclease